VRCFGSKCFFNFARHFGPIPSDTLLFAVMRLPQTAQYRRPLWALGLFIGT
jgi:hypothetical protein